jgi:MoaA/NifB/PqqE/SkfB family radical SAM enzyme
MTFTVTRIQVPDQKPDPVVILSDGEPLMRLTEEDARQLMIALDKALLLHPCLKP